MTRTSSGPSGPRTIAAVRPLRVLPGLADEIGVQRVLWELAAKDGDHDAAERLARLRQYEAGVRGAIASGFLTPARWEREQSGRLHAVDPPVQQIANDLRCYFAAPREGDLLIDADYSAAHLAIAAARSDDTVLLKELATRVDGLDVYSRVARDVLGLAPTRDARKAVKWSMLASINGGSYRTAQRYLAPLAEQLPRRWDGRVERRAGKAAKALDAWFEERFRVLMAYMHGVRQEYERRGPGVHAVRSITGLERMIRVEPRRPGDRGWPTLLSAHWSLVEAEMLDRAMVALDQRLGMVDAYLVLPMYDGLLLGAPDARAEEVRDVVREEMIRAAVASGVLRIRVDVAPPRPTWKEP